MNITIAFKNHKRRINLLLKNDTAMLYSTKNSVKEKISDQVQFNKKIAEMNVPLQILKMMICCPAGLKK